MENENGICAICKLQFTKLPTGKEIICPLCEKKLCEEAYYGRGYECYKQTEIKKDNKGFVSYVFKCLGIL